MSWLGYALLSAVCIATVGVLEKKTMQQEKSMVYVALFSIIKLVLFFIVFGSVTSWVVSSHQLLWLIVDGLIGGFAFLSMAEAMRRMAISKAVPLLALDPGLTALLALLFLGERLRGEQVLGLILLVLGTFILEVHRHPTLEGMAKSPWWKNILIPFKSIWTQPGGIVVLTSMLLFSLSSTIDRYLLKQIPSTTYVGYTLIVITILAFILILWRRPSTQFFKKGSRRVLIFIVLAAVFHLTSTLSQAKAVSIAAVGLVIAVKRLSVLLDVIFGGKLFHEQHLTQRVVASLIMLLGIYFVAHP